MSVILEGWAVPVKMFKIVDHTYVKSKDGLNKWGCWGREEGGSKICSGNGDLEETKRIAGSKGHAGLSYGITGVCHQTANRILITSGQTVSSAKGYFISKAVYGDYGIGDWESLEKCKELFELASLLKEGDKKEAYFEEIALARSEIGWKNISSPEGRDELYRRELIAFIKSRLSGEQDKKTINSILNSQKDLSRKLSFLKGLSPDSNSDNKELIDRINREIQVFLNSVSKGSIDKEEFYKLFDIYPGEELNIAYRSDV